MRIAVPVKWVASLDEDFELAADGSGVDPGDVDWALNEWDEFSLEAALQLREAREDAEVLVVTVGDEDAEDGLLSCLARGADRAIRIWDEGLEALDALGVARVLAAALEPERPDLVLCGAQSSDAADAATGMALAALLDLPRAAVVRGIAVDGPARLAVDRELEGGVVERLTVPLPAVLTVQTGINQPRYANLRGMQRARGKPLATCTLDDLGLERAAVTAAVGSRRRRLLPRPAGQGAQMLDGGSEAVAGEIARIVKERLGR